MAKHSEPVGTMDAEYLGQYAPGMVVDGLHQHAGHSVVIGHPNVFTQRVTLWCDTCDVGILTGTMQRACSDEHNTEHN
jgi:hypothetical protein